MASKSAASNQDKEKDEGMLLPLPAPVLRHHLKTLAGPAGQWLVSKRVPPVLLLSGPSGIGKRSVAHFLAQWLTCERSGLRTHESAGTHGDGGAPEASGDDGASRDEGASSMMDMFGGGAAAPATPAAPAAVPALAGWPDPAAPCGGCPSCQRALKGQWVDFTEIGAETGEGETGSLKIDQFRALKATLGFGAFAGSYKITLIRDADRLTVQAANSLLKILEEPPPGWVFFLTASDPSLLLPTLVSRCQTLRLRPFESADLLELLALAGVPGERRAICAELAQGSRSRALLLAGDEAWLQRSAIFRFLETPTAECNPLVEWAAKDPANFDCLLDQLEQLTADLVRFSAASESAAEFAWKNLDGKRAFGLHTARVLKRLGSRAEARAFWLARSERLFRARPESLAPLNRKLLIQDVLLPWLGV